MATPFEKLKEEIVKDAHSHIWGYVCNACSGGGAEGRANCSSCGGTGITDWNLDWLLKMADRIAKEVAEAGMVEEGAGHWEMDETYCISCGEIKEEHSHHFSWNAARSKSIKKLRDFGVPGV